MNTYQTETFSGPEQHWLGGSNGGLSSRTLADAYHDDVSERHEAADAYDRAFDTALAAGEDAWAALVIAAKAAREVLEWYGRICVRGARV